MDQCVNERPDCKDACQATQNLAICQPKYQMNNEQLKEFIMQQDMYVQLIY